MKNIIVLVASLVFFTCFLFVQKVEGYYPCNCVEETYTCGCNTQCDECCWESNCDQWGNGCTTYCQACCTTTGCSTCTRTVCERCGDPGVTYGPSTSWQYYVVPDNVVRIEVKAWGAGGGNGGCSGNLGGAGGYASSFINVTPGETLKVAVGNGGSGGRSGYCCDPEPDYVYCWCGSCCNGWGGGAGGSGVYGAGGTGGNGSGLSSAGGGGGAGSFLLRDSTILLAAGGGGGGGCDGGFGGAGGQNGGLQYATYSVAGGSSTVNPVACVNGSGSGPGAGGGGYRGGTCGRRGSAGGGGGTSYGTTIMNGNRTTPGNSGDIDRGTAGNTGTAGKIIIFQDTYNTAPSTPTGLLTEGLATPIQVVDLTPEFSAIYNDTDGTNSNYYEMEVNTLFNFTGTVMWDTGQVGMTQIANGSRSADISYAGTALVAGTTYYWRIRFWDIYGLVSTWSDVQSFKINNKPDAPTTPLVNGETNPTNISDTTPKFSAIFTDPNTMDKGKYYEIEVNTASNFTGTVMWDTGLTTLALEISNGSRSYDIAYNGTPLSNDITYYWRIRFWDNYGYAGTWSATQSFKIKPNDPPLIINSDDPTCLMNIDEQCTIDGIIDDLGEEDSVIKGCTNTTYTGNQTNNPLKISLEAVDDSDTSDIIGSIIWLSKNDITGGVTAITSPYTYTNTDNIGIMLLEENGNIVVYASNNNNSWSVISDNKLKRSDGNTLAIITDPSLNRTSTYTKISFTLTFEKNIDSNPSGTYNFNALALYEYMVDPNNTVDQTYIKRYFNWNIDLDNPVIDSFEHTIKTMQNLNLSWSISDTTTNISSAVINAYRSEDSNINTSISMTGQSNTITLENGTPEISSIGTIGTSNQWEFLNLNTTPYSSNADINIGTNEGGSIDMYITAFDQACNFTTTSNSVNLEPWIATKGGILYSRGNILTNAKDLTEVSESYYIIGSTSTFKNINKNELDIGTEAITSREAFIKSLIHSNINNVRATNISDTNDKDNYFFEYFKKSLDEQMEELTPIDNINGCTNSLNNCVLYTTEDITIPSNFICDKTILFMTEGNITINPDVKSTGEGLDGCMFIAKNNIQISTGEYISNNVVGYDYIEGFLFADNQILIPQTDEAEVLRDGLEVNGSLVAMGSIQKGDTAVKQERNLRLYNDINPSLIVVYNNIYSKISEIFFGEKTLIYKKEVGSKLY